jgi:peptidoglycan/LPS O-acetylase OafA/YrhL
MTTHLKHFHWLDLLRFITALTVVVVHTRGTVFVEYGALVETEKTFFVAAACAIARVGNEAVVSFFVLSGFLVGGRALDQIVKGTFRPTDYAVDRFVRIMLPLFPALILTAAIRLIINGTFNILDLVGNTFSLQGIFCSSFGGNTPLWSLSYEVWFYILTYAVGIASIRNRSYLPSVVLLILVAAIFTSLSSVYLFCWLIGAMAYIRMPHKFLWKFLFFSFCLLVYAVIAIQIGQDSVSVSVEYLRSYLPSLGVSRILLSLGVATIIQQVLFIKPTHSFIETLEYAGTALAKSSYTLYLTHYPILQLMSYLGLKRAKIINFSSMGVFLGSILICLLVSWFLYLLFEKHTNAVRKSIKSRLGCDE